MIELPTEKQTPNDFVAAVIKDRGGLASIMDEWRTFIDRGVQGVSLDNEPSIIECDADDSQSELFIVVVRNGGAIQCIAPFHIQPSRYRVRFSVFQVASLNVRQMSLIGNGFICAHHSDVNRCCRHVLEAVRSARCDLCYFCAIDQQSQLWQYCADAENLPPGWRSIRPTACDDWSYRFETALSFEAYLATLGSSTRSSLKRRTKKLVADHGASLTVVTEPGQVRAFLDDADAIYRDSWQAKTYGHVVKNSAAQVTRLEQIARCGWLRSYLLKGDSGPLAFQVGYHYEDVFYARDYAFAQKWSSLGPGAVLMYLMLEHVHHERAPRTVDLGPGDSPQKHTFRGVPRPVGDFYLVPRNRMRPIMFLQRRLSQVEAGVRAVLVRTGCDNAVRRFLKHKT
jgi:hypothetical protein